MPKLAAMITGKAKEIEQRPVSRRGTMLPHVMSKSPEDHLDEVT